MEVGALDERLRTLWLAAGQGEASTSAALQVGSKSTTASY
jgi:hypothetical protein